jgi:hypothetical protein
MEDEARRFFNKIPEVGKTEIIQQIPKARTGSDDA